VLPGVIGVIQGIEAIKLVLGLGDPLIGRLLLFDALGMHFRELTLRKDPDCPLCGRAPSITALIDYDEFCGAGAAGGEAEMSDEIGVKELKRRLDRGEAIALLDVREPHEFAIARIDGATLIPLRSLPSRLGELDRAREIVVLCHHGQRSMRALEFLRGSGFGKISSLRGGIDAWSREVDARVPRY
jgi:adenylyltransferase/sulfurtransferase